MSIKIAWEVTVRSDMWNTLHVCDYKSQADELVKTMEEDGVFSCTIKQIWSK